MSIKSPRTDPSHRGYQAECQSALELALSEIIEGADQAGWSSTAVYDAVQCSSSRSASLTVLILTPPTIRSRSHRLADVVS